MHRGGRVFDAGERRQALACDAYELDEVEPDARDGWDVIVVERQGGGAVRDLGHTVG